MPEIPEFFLFRQYSKAVKQWLYDNCYLQRYPKDQNVLVVYSTPERAFAKYMYPVLNGKPARPIISFHLSGQEYLGENHLGFVKEHKYDTETGTMTMVPPLLIYRLTYNISIYTLLMSDADILMYQMAVGANKNKAGVFKVDGQWAEIVMGDPRDETNLEPGDAQDKILRYGRELIVRRAYLPQEIEKSGVIETTEVGTEVKDEV